MEFNPFSSSFFILPFILGLAYLTCFVTVWFIIYRWVKTFIHLKREQNELLREIVNKMDDKRQIPR